MVNDTSTELKKIVIYSMDLNAQGNIKLLRSFTYNCEALSGNSRIFISSSPV